MRNQVPLASTAADRQLRRTLEMLMGRSGTAAPSAPSQTEQRRAVRTAAHQALGAHFSSKDIELGLQIGAAIEKVRERS